MNKSASQKIKLGIFVLIGTVLLIAALYFIGSKQHLFSNNVYIYAYFTNVNGLQLGNNVRYSGVNVGTVTDIEMKENSRILVQMKMEEKATSFIQKDAVATIGSDGLVGSMVVNIIPGNKYQAALVEGDTIKTYTKIGADDMMNTLSLTNENAALLTADLLKITNNINKGSGTIGMLINDSTMANDLQQTINQLKETSYGTTKAIAELNDILSSMGSKESVAGILMNDEATGKKVKTIIHNLESSSIAIDSFSNNLNEWIVQMKESDGTVNYLMENPELVKNIDSTMINIKEGAAGFNENMEALQSNFLLRGYFKKKEKEERKKAKSTN